MDARMIASIDAACAQLPLEEQMEMEVRFQHRQLAFAESLHRQAEEIEDHARVRLATIAEAEHMLYSGATAPDAALVLLAPVERHLVAIG
jgi:hypothetical protein